MSRAIDSPALLQGIKDAQPEWFSAGNKRFFVDVSYSAYYAKKTGKPFLVRSTYAWSDMLGQPRKLSYRINGINPDTLKIELLVEETFNNLCAARDWLEFN